MLLLFLIIQHTDLVACCVLVRGFFCLFVFTYNRKNLLLSLAPRGHHSKSSTYSLLIFHINPPHVLPHYIHKSSLRSSTFSPSWSLSLYSLFIDTHLHALHRACALFFTFTTSAMSVFTATPASLLFTHTYSVHTSTCSL